MTGCPMGFNVGTAAIVDSVGAVAGGSELVAVGCGVGAGSSVSVGTAVGSTLSAVGVAVRGSL